MKTRTDIHGDLRRMMDGFVGQVFTEEMRQAIRLEATDIMNTAYDEGQAAMAHLICANKGTHICKISGEFDAEYDEDKCRECNREGGFMI